MQKRRSGMRDERSALELDARETTVLRMHGALHFEYKIVHAQRPILDLVDNALAHSIGARPALFVLDNHIKEIYGERLRNYVAATGIKAIYTSLLGEESTKT